LSLTVHKSNPDFAYCSSQRQYCHDPGDKAAASGSHNQQARLPTAIAFTWRAGFLVWQTRKRGNFLKLLVLLGGKLLLNNGRKERNEHIMLKCFDKMYRVTQITFYQSIIC
jgi:hypothetical protein